MVRPTVYPPPMLAEAQNEYAYDDDEKTLYRIYYDSQLQRLMKNMHENLLDTWPSTLTVNGRAWPFLKVVFLLHHKRWPAGPVSYPRGRCDPALIGEAIPRPPHY